MSFLFGLKVMELWRRSQFALVVFLSELAFIIIFGCLVDYGWDATPVSRRRAEFLTEHHAGTSATSTNISYINDPEVNQAKAPEESLYASKSFTIVSEQM